MDAFSSISQCFTSVCFKQWNLIQITCNNVCPFLKNIHSERGHPNGPQVLYQLGRRCVGYDKDLASNVWLYAGMFMTTFIQVQFHSQLRTSGWNVLLSWNANSWPLFLFFSSICSCLPTRIYSNRLERCGSIYRINVPARFNASSTLGPTDLVQGWPNLMNHRSRGSTFKLSKGVNGLSSCP